jgi:hypothetical protein
MLDRQVYFVLGVFVTLIIGVPLSLGIIRGIQGHAIDTAIFFFGALCGALVLLLMIALLRSWILHRLIGTTEARLSEVVETGTKLIKAAAAGKGDEAIDHGSELSKKYVAWHAWTSFYRWTIATAVTLLIAYAGFASVILLLDQNERTSEQTRRIEEQNDLQALSIATELRKEFVEPRNSKALAASGEVGLLLIEWEKARSRLRDLTENCDIVEAESEMYSPSPSKFVIEKARLLARNATMGQRLVDALWMLAHDANPTVAIGATLALDQLGVSLENHKMYIRGIYLEGFSFHGNVKLHFEDSVVIGLICDNCSIIIDNSYFSGSANQLRIHQSYAKLSDEMPKTIEVAGDAIIDIADREVSSISNTLKPSPEFAKNVYVATFKGLFSVSGDGKVNPNLQDRCQAYRPICKEGSPFRCFERQ